MIFVYFGGMFINVLILLCILLLSTFLFVPIGMVETIIRDFVNLFGSLPNIVYSIYSWIFNLISVFVSALAFMYMFNKRFDDIEAFKKQMKEKPVDKENKKDIQEELELPKAKTKNKMK